MSTEINPIQGFKTGGDYVDFRPISAEERLKEEEIAASPLGVPEYATSLPPDQYQSPQSQPPTEAELEAVANMKREKLQSLSQPPAPEAPASAAKVSLPQAPAITKSDS